MVSRCLNKCERCTIVCNLLAKCRSTVFCDAPDDDDQIEHALLAALEQPRERVSAPSNCTALLPQCEICVLSRWEVRSIICRAAMMRLLKTSAALRACIVHCSPAASNVLVNICCCALQYSSVLLTAACCAANAQDPYIVPLVTRALWCAADCAQV
jgi:hypothetical protein